MGTGHGNNPTHVWHSSAKIRIILGLKNLVSLESDQTPGGVNLKSQNPNTNNHRLANWNLSFAILDKGQDCFLDSLESDQTPGGVNLKSQNPNTNYHQLANCHLPPACRQASLSFAILDKGQDCFLVSLESGLGEGITRKAVLAAPLFIVNC